jgi:hypothetical protein
VFAPAALGAVLNDATISSLRCRVVCGGANNQLAEARHDAALAVRGIVFVPDYLGATLTTLYLSFEKEAETALGLPPGVHSYALLPISYPMGRFGPVPPCRSR